MEDHQWEGLVAALETLSQGPYWVNDTAGLSVTALRSKARRLQAQHGLDLVHQGMNCPQGRSEFVREPVQGVTDLLKLVMTVQLETDAEVRDTLEKSF